jgi:predicted Zn-dependent protease
MEFVGSDYYHLRSADGWLDLGNHLEASAELDGISAAVQNHPVVLQMRWRISAKAKQWGNCVAIASTLTTVAPENPQGWINLGNALYFSGHTQAAYDQIHAVLPQFPKDHFLHYNLACYACQLGLLEEAKDMLGQAFKMDEATNLKSQALQDLDLKPLWDWLA